MWDQIRLWVLYIMVLEAFSITLNLIILLFPEMFVYIPFCREFSLEPLKDELKFWTSIIFDMIITRNYDTNFWHKIGYSLSNGTYPWTLKIGKMKKYCTPTVIWITFMRNVNVKKKVNVVKTWTLKNIFTFTFTVRFTYVYVTHKRN